MADMEARLAQWKAARAQRKQASTKHEQYKATLQKKQGSKRRRDPPQAEAKSHESAGTEGSKGLSERSANTSNSQESTERPAKVSRRPHTASSSKQQHSSRAVTRKPAGDSSAPSFEVYKDAPVRRIRGMDRGVKASLESMWKDGRGPPHGSASGKAPVLASTVAVQTAPVAAEPPVSASTAARLEEYMSDAVEERVVLMQQLVATHKAVQKLLGQPGRRPVVQSSCGVQTETPAAIDVVVSLNAELDAARQDAAALRADNTALRATLESLVADYDTLQERCTAAEAAAELSAPPPTATCAAQTEPASAQHQAVQCEGIQGCESPAPEPATPGAARLRPFEADAEHTVRSLQRRMSSVQEEVVSLRAANNILLQQLRDKKHKSEAADAEAAQRLAALAAEKDASAAEYQQRMDSQLAELQTQMAQGLAASVAKVTELQGKLQERDARIAELMEQVQAQE